MGVTTREYIKIQYITVQYSTLKYSTVQYIKVQYSTVQCTDLVICIVIPGQCTLLTLYVPCIQSMLILGLYVLNVYIRETECQNVYVIVKHTNMKRHIFCKNQEYKKK